VHFAELHVHNPALSRFRLSPGKDYPFLMPLHIITAWMTPQLAIKNIGELILVPRGPIGGRSMNNVRRLPSAAILCENGSITWLGANSELATPPGCSTFDARGGCVVPGLVDCHTHSVFAGTREFEFVQRIEGRSYTEIAESGGGIRVTVSAVRAARKEQLLDLALLRLKRMLKNGVTTVEIKSGYGLTVEDELNMLEVIRDLAARQPIETVATYMAAHTTPGEFAGRPDEYLASVFSEPVLRRIRDNRLAEFCDVFCEQTAFTVDQSRRILLAAKQFGLTPKLHADQITRIGASALAAEVGAISADHLERIDEIGIAAMKNARTIAVLLPACSFFLGVDQAPARTLITSDLPVAIATDYNPGSSMVESLPLTMSIACTQMRMTPMEALVAATANAAAAIARYDRLGAIAPGLQADLVILDVPNLERWVYEPGRNCVRAVVKQGRIVAEVAD
jgi:imidazolonepropionase